MPRSCALVFTVLASAACGAGGGPAGDKGELEAVPALRNSASVASRSVPAGSVSATGVTRALADGGAEEASAPGVWRVEYRSGRNGQPVVSRWPELQHHWTKGAPKDLVAETNLCLPKGEYVFDLLAAPSWHSDITVDGEPVITQRDYPTELSKPIAFGERCRTVRAHLENPLSWKELMLSLVVRKAASAPPCDAGSFPTKQWNLCLFHGRSREEPIGTMLSDKLEVPANQAPGKHDSFDWYALEARKTVCFSKGTYIVHSDSDETLNVRVGEQVVLDAVTTGFLYVKESERVNLDGCAKVTVIHTYRYAHSRLKLGWAKVGSPEERGWAADRACGFRCDAESVCIPAKALASPHVTEATCVPTKRRGHFGEYCDDKHRCSLQAPLCVRNRCYED
ncbi:MAG: hypothetical protein U0174_08530 [Polyangiaceae bacterium]